MYRSDNKNIRNGCMNKLSNDNYTEYEEFLAGDLVQDKCQDFSDKQVLWEKLYEKDNLFCQTACDLFLTKRIRSGVSTLTAEKYFCISLIQ